MGAFGDRLRREREMRGITLDEIAESTKISRRHLESLEKEDFESLPGGIFNKGFVRAYARYLGIDEDQAVADYSANSDEVPPPEDQFPLEIHEEPDRKMNPRRARWPLIGATAAVVAVAVGYTLWAKKGNHHGVASSVSAAGPVAAGNSSSASDTKTSAVQNTIASQSKAAPAPATNQAPVAVPVKQVAAVVAPANSAPPAPVPAARPRPQPPEHTFFIIIKAKEDSWISVVADGHRVAHGTLRADKQRFIRAGKQIIVTTGNAGGLEVSYNGKPLGVIGNEAEARTMTFTPTGLTN
jgi:cytoskeleton protein RodZ